jgi:thiol:disulfide interchange protein
MLLLSVGVLTTVLATWGCGRQQADTQTAGSSAAVDVVSSHGVGDLLWETEWDRAFARAKSEGKPVLVDFYADWCVWCKRLDTTTLNDPQVVALLQDRVVPLKLDVDGGGREPAGVHGVESLPTIVVLSAGGEELGRIPGYMPPTGFLESLQGFLTSES